MPPSLPRDRVLYLVTGSQGEPRAALSRIATGSHPNVALTAGDSVIFSSRIIPGNELGIFELHNRLSEIGVEVLTEQDHFVHVSGHPYRDELAEMYRWVRPKISVPVHGELRHMAEHARLAKSLQVPEAVVIQNGQMVRLAPGKAQIIDEVPSGRVHLDGRVLVAEGEGFARHRRAMGFAGLIAITLVLDQKGRVAAEPSVFLEGLPEAVHGRRSARPSTKPCAATTPSAPTRTRWPSRCAAPPARPRPVAWGKKPITRVEVVWV